MVELKVTVIRDEKGDVKAEYPAGALADVEMILWSALGYIQRELMYAHIAQRQQGVREAAALQGLLNTKPPSRFH